MRQLSQALARLATPPWVLRAGQVCDCPPTVIGQYKTWLDAGRSVPALEQSIEMPWRCARESLYTPVWEKSLYSNPVKVKYVANFGAM
jgi:hypothetical protein